MRDDFTADVDQEVLQLVNVNDDEESDEDEEEVKPEPFLATRIKVEPLTPTIESTEGRMEREAQRLLNQVTKSFKTQPQRSAQSGLNLSLANSRRTSADTNMATPISPLEDESGRAGNTNFLVDMARMSTTMNGQPVQAQNNGHQASTPTIPGQEAFMGDELDDDDQDEEPLYVNAKQYHRILKRRAARARLEEMNRVVKERKVRLWILRDCLIRRIAVWTL